MIQTASFWTPIKNSTVQCNLCPHNCKIQPNATGICGVRQNQNGTLKALTYQKCSSIAVDPIEKKPLFHFHPTTNVLSLGSIGCNFQCSHCQNYSISQKKPGEYPLTELSPQAAIKEAQMRQCQGIAWTYNEPTIWYEYTLDTAHLAKKHSLYTVYVTNGYINEEPLRQLSQYLDAMNIDVKAYDDKFYSKICKAHLEPVKKTCKLAQSLGIHIELTYLVIPEKNDTDKEIQSFSNWIADTLGKDIPVHFSRFHPDYQLTNINITPIETLLRIKKIAEKAGLQYIYLGNILYKDAENTRCPNCGIDIIQRQGFSSQIVGLDDNKCRKCHTPIPLVINTKNS